MGSQPNRRSLRRPAGQEIGDKLSRLLRIRFVSMLLMLAAVSAGAFAVFHTLVNGQDQGATLIDVSGRQRMVVQRIAVETLRLVDAPPADRETIRAELAALAQSLRADQGAADYEAVGKTAKVRAEEILFGEPYHLARQTKDFGDAVDALVRLPDGELRRDQPLVLRIEAMAEGPLRHAAAALVSVFAEGMRGRVNDLHIFAAGGESLFLALLVVMAWKVFRPLLEQTDTALNQLAALENYHRSVLDALADGILVIEPIQRLVERMNPAAQAIFHLDEGVGIGQPLDALIPATAHESVPKLRRWDRHEVRGQTADGTAFHLKVTVREAPVDGKDRLIAVIRDVTRQVEAEKKVHTLNYALEQSGASVMITDTDGIITYANPRACENSGYSRDDLLGQSPRILQSGETSPQVYEDMWRRLKAGEEWRGELLNRKKNGDLHWESVVISPLRDADGEIGEYMAVKEDITDRKRMEEALVFAKHQAERANRTKSDFLASMSHELRTPLNAIIGYSEFIDIEPFGPIGHTKYREYVGHIHESGCHLLELINDMLDLSKIEAGKLVLEDEDVDLAHGIEGAIHLVMERATRRGLQLTAEVAPGLPCLRADKLRLKQVMLNLLSNAIKFTPEGGKVTLRALVAADGAVEIIVADTGIGIAPEDISKVVEPFGQVANPMVRREEGTGLGLPITKQLVELHGGQLSIDSEPGRGTTVTVRLPAARVREAATADL